MFGSRAEGGSRGRPLRAPVVLVLACAGIGLAAGVAAGAKLKTRSTVVSLPSDTTGEALASCPKKTKLISGGFAGEQTAVGGAVFTFASTRRTGKQQGSSAVNFGAQPGSITTYAYCQVGKFSVRSAQVTIPAGAPTAVLGAATATCPKGSTAVSGGFAGSRGPDVDIRPYESRLTGKRTWTASAYSFGSASGTLTTQVSCQKKGGKLKAASATTSVAGNSTGTAKATCKKGLRSLSGGFLAESSLTDINPFASFKEGNRGWRVSGLNGGPTQAGDLTAYAYCRKG
jgi:hypothetical protein